MLVEHDLEVQSPSMGAFSGDRVGGKSSTKTSPLIDASLRTL
jgi:hypothetical protein